ncbi:MAG: histidine kinase [Sphingomonas bacterium]|uniref:sensor histidine kinase n=1 Tax=Sphingomonas bacterium TaxID=1895847 RepID=UPI002630CFD0|nr:PAS domain-containing protein [Sphingomonas bacterium]MDB5706372.1 histidine kinase [Sphingomonas bacterium]
MCESSPARSVATSGWRIDDAARAETIAAHNIESLHGSDGLKQITDFAAALCEAPVALVNLVEQRRQTFIARTGYDAPEGRAETSFCAVAMLEPEIMVVPDATRDPRFADNPQVTGAPFIRFYAGAPLLSDDGIPLGSLCVIDTAPRDGLTPLQYQGLATLAEAVMARLRDSRDAAAWRATENATHRALNESHSRFRVLADSMPQMVWSTLPDGYHDYYNARWYEFTGMPEGSTDGEEWNGMFHPDDQERAWETWRHSLATGDPYQIEYRLRRADGDYRWTLGRALPLRDETDTIVRWFGTCTDIHEQKQASEEREVIAQELSHRIKNIFAVIAGLVGFAARAKPELASITEDLRERITALGRAHDFVRPHSAQSRPAVAQNSLHGLLGELFRPYQAADTPRIVITGADVDIDDRSTTPLALLFHELATNATKYGALLRDDGRIGLDISTGEPTIVLRWSETGGPPVTAPSAIMGFGSQLVEMSAVRQLGGTVTREWLPEGLVMIIEVPRTAFSRR